MIRIERWAKGYMGYAIGIISGFVEGKVSREQGC